MMTDDHLFVCDDFCPNNIKKNIDVVSNSDKCDLKCTKDKKQVEYVEYVGPVHLSLIEPPGYVYRKTMVETGLLNLAYFLIGSTVMIPIYYTLLFKHYWPMNGHIFLATVGSQIFMPGFFLQLNSLDCAGMWLKSRDKRKGSCLLNFFAVVFIWLGVAVIFVYKEYYLTYITVHFSLGLAGAGFCILNLFTSCCFMADEDSALGKFAQVISVPAYIFLTASFITGLLKPTMVDWYPERHMVMFLAGFCIMYSAIIIYRPIKNYFNMS